MQIQNRSMSDPPLSEIDLKKWLWSELPLKSVSPQVRTAFSRPCLAGQTFKKNRTESGQTVKLRTENPDITWTADRHRMGFPENRDMASAIQFTPRPFSPIKSLLYLARRENVHVRRTLS